MTFPANLLLEREEIETGKRTGVSVVTCIHHGHGNITRAYVEAPFDIMYGFRGEKYNVDLLCPYEMLLHWEMVRIMPPSKKADVQRSTWTQKGFAYMRASRICGNKPNFQAGRHYEALDGSDRILIPDYKVLHGLRHQWCWERRHRLHIPVWSYAKVPQAKFSPEENGRLLSVYMRPWTLDASSVQEDNPRLQDLACNQFKGLSEHDGECAKTQKDISYAGSWDGYIRGNIISETSRRYIANLLAVSAATRAEQQNDSSDDSDAEEWANANRDAGNLELVKKR